MEDTAVAALAALALQDWGETGCRCACSAKHWITDPQGVAREHFHTLAGIARGQRAAR